MQISIISKSQWSQHFIRSSHRIDVDGNSILPVDVSQICCLSLRDQGSAHIPLGPPPILTTLSVGSLRSKGLPTVVFLLSIHGFSRQRTTTVAITADSSYSLHFYTTKLVWTPWNTRQLISWWPGVACLRTRHQPYSLYHDLQRLQKRVLYLQKDDTHGIHFDLTEHSSIHPRWFTWSSLAILSAWIASSNIYRHPERAHSYWPVDRALER